MLIDNVFNFVKPDKGAQFILYLIGHADPSTKIFSETYKQIQKDLGISEPTISRFFKILEESGTIARAGFGKWYIKAVVGESDSCDGPDFFVTKGYVPKR